MKRSRSIIHLRTNRNHSPSRDVWERISNRLDDLAEREGITAEKIDRIRRRLFGVLPETEAPRESTHSIP